MHDAGAAEGVDTVAVDRGRLARAIAEAIRVAAWVLETPQLLAGLGVPGDNGFFFAVLKDRDRATIANRDAGEAETGLRFPQLLWAGFRPLREDVRLRRHAV